MEGPTSQDQIFCEARAGQWRLQITVDPQEEEMHRHLQHTRESMITRPGERQNEDNVNGKFNCIRYPVGI